MGFPISLPPKSSGFFAGLLLVLLAAVAAGAVPVRAQPVQTSQTSELPPRGSSLRPPDGPTRVRLTAETVVIEAAANRPEQAPYAKVEASYLLTNPAAAEEQMLLRYPLSLADERSPAECAYSPYEPLRYFQVWVDERPISARIEYEMVANGGARHSYDPPRVNRACWAVFPVSFPPGAQVSVRLRFEQEAGAAGYPGYAVFRYARQTGDAWDGPVGKSEVTFHAPWHLTDETLLEYSPASGERPRPAPGGGAQSAETAAREIRWSYPPGEPTAKDDVLARILNPPVYREINRGRLLYPGSRRGEAWGRYGLAAKRAILSEDGFRAGIWPERLYRESYDAYSHAVALLPWNADWHAGFAELLCTNAAHSLFDPEWSSVERWQACAEQIQAALRINPRQELALRLANQHGTDPRWLFVENGTPVFPILSLTPPPRQTLTPTPE